MTTTLRSTTVVLDHDGPLLELAADPTAIVWLHREDGFVAWGEAARCPVPPGADRGAIVQTWFDELVSVSSVEDEVRLPATGLLLVASFPFDLSEDDGVAVVPAVVVGRRAGVTWVTRIHPADAEPPPMPTVAAAEPVQPRSDRVRYAGSTQPDLHYLAAVADAVDRIADGALEKVVLARDHQVWSHEVFDPRELATRLHRRFPNCFTFHVRGLVGASPELLARVDGRRVRSEVLAGTTPTSPDPDRDRRLGEALLDSDKDLREHAYAAIAVEEVLSRITTDLQRAGPQLKRLDNVQHLATRVEGQLTSKMTALEVAELLHPTPAVGGTPDDVAGALIAEAEGMSRGRYAAPVGWIDARGDGEFAIALRCAMVRGTRARLFAGAGIVRGSLPEDELEETRVKLHAMQSAFA